MNVGFRCTELQSLRQRCGDDDIERKARQLGREMHDMFARTARDFQHEPLFRQNPAQDFQDGPPVAGRGGR